MLMSALELRGVRLPNRIGMSPMCMYSAQDGMANDWHLVHLGARAVGGAGLVLAEATGVTPDGRISPEDLGLWSDAQIEPLERVTRFIRSQGAVAGIQLSHAGRKGSTWALAKGDGAVPLDQGGWSVRGASDVPFAEHYPTPRAMDAADIDEIVQAFADSARRAATAGFEVVELHGAHGYLMHQFLSPLSNTRSDEYGGSFENRVRFPLAVVRAVRGALPDHTPLVVRISATDWADTGGWDLEQAVELSRLLAREGVDLLDVSSGGTLHTPSIPVGHGYQASFSSEIRRTSGLPTSTVGLMTHPTQAEHALRSGQADLVLIGRELLRDPHWPLHAAAELREATGWPRAYLRAAPSNAYDRLDRPEAG